MIRDFDQLMEIALGGPRKKIIVVSAHDLHTLEGICDACRKGIAEPILLGKEKLIREIIQKEPLDFPSVTIVHSPDDREGARIAVQMLRKGQGDVLMKGNCKTADLLRAVVHKDSGLWDGHTMSHVGLFQIPGYHKLVAITDGGMIPHPSLEEKRELIKNAVELLKALGCTMPKVACLAAGEDVNPNAPETLHGAKLKEMNEKGEIRDCIVEGPISYDLAMSREAAEAKHYQSPVVGDGDILLVPDMAAGNILAKSWTVTCGGTMSGVVTGAGAPIVLASRGASTKEKFLSIVLAALAAG